MFQSEFLKMCRTLRNGYLRSPICTPAPPPSCQKRHIGINFLLEWFNNVFNSVDKERVELVGPDCACAEWLLRNGASVRFKGHPEMLSDYNTLIALEESGEQKHLKVEDIHARGADISVWGFDHLKNCNHVKKISLIFCNRITDSALFKLKYVENTLQYLEITSCFNVKDEGVKSLAQLRNLTVLKLGDLVSVKNVEDCKADLRRGLPKCKIEFNKSS